MSMPIYNSTLISHHLHPPGVKAPTWNMVQGKIPNTTFNMLEEVTTERLVRILDEVMSMPFYPYLSPFYCHILSPC